jgi:adenylosuccinate synthase
MAKLPGLPALPPEVVAKAEAIVRARAHDRFPASSDLGGACTPIYETLPGWKEPLDDVHDEAHLPKAARDYVAFLEAKLGVSIDWLSVGKRRDQLIARRGESPWPNG